MDSTEQRLVKVFETVFPDLPADRIRTATQTSVENWDSVAAITLINVIEEEFGIEMDFADAADLVSFPKILEYVEERASRTAV